MVTVPQKIKSSKAYNLFSFFVSHNIKNKKNGARADTSKERIVTLEA